MQTELAASSAVPVYLVQIGFSSLTLRLSSLNRDISWDSQTWLGNSWLMPIRPVQETAEVRAVGVEIQLVGISSSLLSLALQNAAQNQNAIIYLGMLNSSGAVITDPVTLFKGKVDTVELVDSVDLPSVSIRCESNLARLDRPQNFRYTNENQKAMFAGDLGFAFMQSLEDWTGWWGKSERPKWLKRRRRAQK
jgi:hypothetical protein